MVKPAMRPLRGQVAVPGDKSIGHRSLIFASLAEGTSEIHGLSDGLDNVATRRAFSRMGVDISERQDGDESFVRVKGVGLDGLRAPTADIDCGNSGTTMRLLAGLLCGQRFASTLFGDASLSKRPMARVTKPLRQRGALIEGRPFQDAQGKQNELPPLHVRAAQSRLASLHYESPVASAQVKSAVLLSGLYADGDTSVREPKLSRDHTERMMRALEIPLRLEGDILRLETAGWDRRFGGFRWRVPGDFSSAAFLIAAASIVPGSDITINNVGLNPTRTGFLDALREMGADIEIAEQRDAERCPPAGDEPIVRLRVKAAQLSATDFRGELVTRMIDEVPVLSMCCAVARGESSVRDALELRVKESDRIATMAKVLSAFGIQAKELEDGLLIDGATPSRGASVAAEHDHRVAMSAAVLALVAPEPTRITDADCVATSYPSFVADLQSLGADLRMEGDR